MLSVTSSHCTHFREGGKANTQFSAKAALINKDGKQTYILVRPYTCVVRVYVCFPVSIHSGASVCPNTSYMCVCLCAFYIFHQFMCQGCIY